MRTGELNFTLPAFNPSMNLKYIIQTHKMTLKATGQALKWLITQNSNFKQTQFLGIQHSKAIKDAFTYF